MRTIISLLTVISILIPSIGSAGTNYTFKYGGPKFTDSNCGVPAANGARTILTYITGNVLNPSNACANARSEKLKQVGQCFQTRSWGYLSAGGSYRLDMVGTCSHVN